MSLPRPPKHTPKRQAEIDRLSKLIIKNQRKLELMRGKLFHMTYGTKG